jgi:hypothetical protein
VLRVVRWAFLGLGLVAALAVVLLLSYYLPSARKVHVVGIEVKRMESDNPKGGTDRDVRFIYARDAETGRSLAYRNEDTGWSFPFFLKFNSGDLAAEAANIQESDPDATVLIKSYGWRFQFFDAYPNALSLRVVAPEYTHIPVFNIVVLTLMLGVIGVLAFYTYKLYRRIVAWAEPEEEETA